MIDSIDTRNRCADGMIDSIDTCDRDADDMTNSIDIRDKGLGGMTNSIYTLNRGVDYVIIDNTDTRNREVDDMIDKTDTREHGSNRRYNNIDNRNTITDKKNKRNSITANASMPSYERTDLLLQYKANALLNQERKNLNQLQNELKSTKGGTLYIKQSGRKVFYTEYSHGKERGIGHDMDKVHKLARRNYIDSISQQSKNNCLSLKKFADTLETDNTSSPTSRLLQKYEKYGLDMDKILLSHKQYEWLHQTYIRNPLYPEELKYTTTNGLLMRTKSELIIANRLEHYHIPYLPEMPLWFDFNSYPYYPDFTILKLDGSIIIWEHMGLMEQDDYFMKNCKKIREYRQNGYSQNTNLIITWEDDISEQYMIDDIIERRIVL